MLDRTKAPAFQRTLEFDLLRPETVQLKNGSVIHFLSGGQQEVTKIEIIFHSGRWFEQTPGAAHFTANLISKGTAGKTSFDIASIFDLYGAHLEISPGLDVTSVALYSMNRHLTQVLPLLFEIFTTSIFPEKELGQSKVIFLQNLKVNREKTSFHASKVFRKSLFGEAHPYGKELDEPDVERLERTNLESHYRNFFRDYFTVVSGLIDDESKAYISSMIAGLPFHAVQQPVYTPHLNKATRIYQEKEDSVQATVRVGKRFIGRSHPDYHDVLLLNHILGGYFGSRLMKNIREEKGLTYGVYSSIHTLINDNYLVIGADVNKDNLDLTFDEIRKEITRLRTEPVPYEELQTARNHFIGSLQGEITTPFSHADKLKNLVLFGLPDDYYSRLIRRMDAVTADELMHKAFVHLPEDSFFEVAVG